MRWVVPIHAAAVQIGLGNAADVRNAARRIVSRHGFEFVEADGMPGDEVAIHVSAGDEKVDDAVHESRVRPNADLQVQVRPLPHCRRLARIDGDDSGAVCLLRGKHPLPQNGLGISHVMTVETEQFGLIDVSVGCDRAVHAESRS